MHGEQNREQRRHRVNLFELESQFRAYGDDREDADYLQLDLRLVKVAQVLHYLEARDADGCRGAEACEVIDHADVLDLLV